MDPTIKRAALMAVEHDNVELAKDLLNFAARASGGLLSPSVTPNPVSFNVRRAVASPHVGSGGVPGEHGGPSSHSVASALLSPVSNHVHGGPDLTGMPRLGSSAISSSRSETRPAQSSPIPLPVLPQPDSEDGRRLQDINTQRRAVSVVIPPPAAPARAITTRPDPAAIAGTNNQLSLRSHLMPGPGAADAREWILLTDMAFMQIGRDRNTGTVCTWGLSRITTAFREEVSERIRGYAASPRWVKAWNDLDAQPVIDKKKQICLEMKKRPNPMFQARCVASQMYDYRPKYTGASGLPEFACDACVNRKQLCIRKLKKKDLTLLVLFSLPRRERVEKRIPKKGPRRMGYYIRGGDDKLS